MKDRLLVVAASGEVGEGARIFHTKLQAMNAEPRERCKVKQWPHLLIIYKSMLRQQAEVQVKITATKAKRKLCATYGK
jgi:hypothetical protein